MIDDILVLNALRHKYESVWRKTRLTVHWGAWKKRAHRDPCEMSCTVTWIVYNIMTVR